MNRILVLFAHPALEKSRVNRQLAAAVRELPGVTFHDLYETYPEFDIDVPREQDLLVQHDVIVLQHPFFWYSTPALLKEWQDLVLAHGWAYGSEGKMLQGKQALSVVTTGGREQAYDPEGLNRFTMRQFLAPIEQTFRLCGVEYRPPFVVHGTLGMTGRGDPLPRRGLSTFAGGTSRGDCGFGGRSRSSAPQFEPGRRAAGRRGGV